MSKKNETKTQQNPTLKVFSAENVNIVVNSVKNVELINGGYYGADANLNISVFNEATGEPIKEDIELDDKYNISPVSDESILDYYFDEQDEYLYENDEEYKAAWDKYNEDGEYNFEDPCDKLAWEWVYKHLDDYYNDIYLNGCYDGDYDCFLSDETKEEIFDDVFGKYLIIYDNEHIIDVDDADDDVFNMNTEERCYHYKDEDRNIDIYFDRDYNLLTKVKPGKIAACFEDMYYDYNEVIFA